MPVKDCKAVHVWIAWLDGGCEDVPVLHTVLTSAPSRGKHPSSNLQNRLSFTWAVFPEKVYAIVAQTNSLDIMLSWHVDGLRVMPRHYAFHSSQVVYLHSPFLPCPF